MAPVAEAEGVRARQHLLRKLIRRDLDFGQAVAQEADGSDCRHDKRRKADDFAAWCAGAVSAVYSCPAGGNF